METKVKKDNHILPNILITGVPGTGKTTLSKLLHVQLNESINQKLGTIGIEYYKYIPVGEVIKENHLWNEFDEERQCSIFNEDMVLDFLENIIPKGGCIVDFHSSGFFPERYFDMVILLRCDNPILYKRLEARGYPQEKITENVDCEIHDVVKEEVFDSYKPDIILEAWNNKDEDVGTIMGFIFEALKKLDFLHKVENRPSNNLF